MAVEGSAAAVAAAGLPGVESLAFLVDADESVLSPSDLVDAVIASERLLASVNAHQSRLLAELGRPGRCGDITRLIDALVDKGGKGRDSSGEVAAVVVDEETARRAVSVAASEVAAVLDWSAITAGIRIRQAQRLHDDLPQTMRALAAGRVDVGRVRLILERTAVLDGPTVGGVEGRILRWVKGRSKGKLETLIDREVIKADPDAAEKRRQKANGDRRVDHRVDQDGMGVINALLPAEAAVMVFTLVDVIADANKGLDGRTVDQRRADAIADIADELLTHGYVDLHGLVARAEQAQNNAAAGAGADETDGTATEDDDTTDTDATTAVGDDDTTDTETTTAVGDDDTTDTDATTAADDGTTDTDTTTAVGDDDPVETTSAGPDTGATSSEPEPVNPVDDRPQPTATSGPDGADVDDPEPGTSSNSTDDSDSAAPRSATSIQTPDPTPKGGPEPDLDPEAKAERLRRAMSRHGRRPHLVVTGAWTTLAGLDDLPGELDGHGTITAQLLRQIAASWGSVTAVGVNPITGTATAVGGTAYRPRQKVSDQVILLSGTCRVAGCRMPAWKCELDHVDPYNHTNPAAGGQSTLSGLLPACKWHHLLKHHTNWTPHLREDLSVVWTTNTGHRSTSHPRSFTLPGEWSSNTGASETGFAPATSDQGDKSVLGSDAGPESLFGDHSAATASAELPPDGNLLAPTTIESTTIKSTTAGSIILGPVVTGPTIPVPVPPDHEEAHTELEDPDTVPHPGSTEIHTYRILREQARETSLRRIRRLGTSRLGHPTTVRRPGATEVVALDRNHVPDPPTPADDEYRAARIDYLLEQLPSVRETLMRLTGSRTATLGSVALAQPAEDFELPGDVPF